MNRNQRREAKENKRAGHAGIVGRIASGNHLSASNDEPEPLSEADLKLARDFAGPGNVVNMLPWYWAGALPPNIWLGATVVNQEEADRDIPKLLATPARVRFLSMEPPRASDFQPGDRVLYVPNHAHGDTAHPDCERGVVTSTNDVNVFVRYGNELHAKATSPEDLVPATGSAA